MLALRKRRHIYFKKHLCLIKIGNFGEKNPYLKYVYSFLQAQELYFVKAITLLVEGFFLGIEGP